MPKNLDMNDPRYLRRLVKLLNAIPSGGFINLRRKFLVARFSKGCLQGRSVSGERWSLLTNVCRDPVTGKIFIADRTIR